jgi:hypothetical protein
MGNTLSSKNKKRARDQRRAHVEGKAPAKHKVAVERSRKALLKKAFPMK